ncbi:predicted protein [Nematostella vectensis]|uniref:SAP domain-containing protein n=1 Tax=Nematostella vectensis TaxID=45351 RepID=A7RR29_NEMVE|nr:predicted protein [Nematostella vectensis]|eukprot:XP_001638104.1 predicted protein [Nematostella vectensis]
MSNSEKTYDDGRTTREETSCAQLARYDMTPSKQKFSFIKSMDDKAYIRPGTSEGLEKTRNTKILTLSGEGARQLPKYDWPEKAVYQTPAAHRIMEKESITMDDGSEKLITVNDNHIVIVRPKSYVPSSGTMWANETHRLRSAELDRLYNRDYRIRVHRSRGDSGQNEAERTNSAIGDAVVDGATIKWEHYKRFHGMTKEEIADLTIEEFDALEDQRMERNAWRITHQLAERIDGAPVLSDFINGIASESPDDMFFFNDNYLSQYTSKSKSLRATVPGASYFDKIFTFIELHLQTGELYTEFLKESCKKTLGTSCEYCLKNPWSGPVMTRIPRPFPSADDLPEFHYKNVHSTPLTDSKGNDRGPDDWQPRANIKKLFEQKKLSLEDNEEIKKFSQAFIVDEKYELIENGKLPSLVVSELDKYLIHYNLSKTGKKKDKIRRITVHYYNQDRRAVPDDQPVADFDQQFGSEDSENESDSDEDLVLCDSSSDSDSDSSDCDGDEEGGSAEVLTSRSGRKTTQNSRFADFVLY